MTRCLRRLLLTLILTAFLNNFPNNSSTNTTVTKYSFSLAQFWTSLLSFFAELQKELHPLTKENRELNAVFTEQRNLFIELAACSAQIKSKAELLKLFEFITNKLLALEKVLQQLAIAAIPRTSPGMDGQLLLTEQITVTCKKQLTKLQQILKLLSLLKNTLEIKQNGHDINGNSLRGTFTLEFKDNASMQTFDPTKFLELSEEDFIKVGILRLEGKVDVIGVPDPTRDYMRRHLATKPYNWQAPITRTLNENVTPSMPQIHDPSWHDNLNISGHSFESNTTYYVPSFHRMSEEERNVFFAAYDAHLECQRAAKQINQMFGHDNAAQGLFNNKINQNPQLASFLDTFGEELKKKFTFKHADFERCGDEEILDGFARNLYDGDGTEPSGPRGNGGNENNNPPEEPENAAEPPQKPVKKAKPFAPLFTEAHRQQAQDYCRNFLQQQGTFKNFTSVANKNLCDLSGHFYAQGMQDMAQKLEQFIAAQDRLVAGISNQERFMKNLLAKSNNSIPANLKSNLTAELELNGQKLSCTLSDSTKTLDKEALDRLRLAEEYFVKNLPLPKNFLADLSPKNQKILFAYIHNTIGRAHQINATVANMHVFSNISLGIGFQEGYDQASKDLKQEILANENRHKWTRAALKREQQQHLQTRSHHEQERKNREEAFTAEKQQLKLTAGFAAKQAQEAKTALGKAEAEKQTAEQHAQQAAEKLQTAEADKQKAAVELERKNQENQKLKTLAMHTLSNTQTKNSAPGTAPQENGSTKSTAESNHALEAENARLRAENLMYKKQSIDLQSAPPKEVRVFIPNPNISEAEMTKQIKGQLQAEQALRADKKLIAEKGLELNVEHQRIEKMEESQAKLLAQNKHQEKELELMKEENNLLKKQNAMQQSLLNSTTHMLDQASRETINEKKK